MLWSQTDTDTHTARRTPYLHITQHAETTCAASTESLFVWHYIKFLPSGNTWNKGSDKQTSSDIYIVGRRMCKVCCRSLLSHNYCCNFLDDHQVMPWPTTKAGPGLLWIPIMTSPWLTAPWLTEAPGGTKTVTWPTSTATGVTPGTVWWVNEAEGWLLSSLWRHFWRGFSEQETDQMKGQMCFWGSKDVMFRYWSLLSSSVLRFL